MTFLCTLQRQAWSSRSRSHLSFVCLRALFASDAKLERTPVSRREREPAAFFVAPSCDSSVKGETFFQVPVWEIAFSFPCTPNAVRSA